MLAYTVERKSSQFGGVTLSRINCECGWVSVWFHDDGYAREAISLHMADRFYADQHAQEKVTA